MGIEKNQEKNEKAWRGTFGNSHSSSGLRFAIERKVNDTARLFTYVLQIILTLSLGKIPNLSVHTK
jgi:hypothetical protein